MDKEWEHHPHTQPDTTGDPIIHPIFDGRINRRKCWLPAFSPFPTMFSYFSKEFLISLQLLFFPPKYFKYGLLYDFVYGKELKPILCVKQLNKILSHYHTMPHFDVQKIYSYRKHCEKRRNCL